MTEQLRRPHAPVPPSRRRRLLDRAVDVVPAALLVVALSWAVVVDAAAPVRVVTLALALAASVVVLWRRTAIGGWELVATTIGALIAVLAVAGVLLDRLPGGIDRTGWAATAGTVGLLTLAVAGVRPVVRPLPLPRPRRGLALALATAAAAVLVAVAVGIAVTASRLTDVPPTQMWLDTTAAGGTVVALRAPDPVGPYDLWLEPDDGPPVLLASGLTVAGGRTTTVPLPEVTERSSVVLRSPASPDPVRTLIVEPD